MSGETEDTNVPMEGIIEAPLLDSTSTNNTNNCCSSSRSSQKSDTNTNSNNAPTSTGQKNETNTQDTFYNNHTSNGLDHVNGFGHLFDDDDLD